MISKKQDAFLFSLQAIARRASVNYFLGNDILLHIKVWDDPFHVKINDRLDGKWRTEQHLMAGASPEASGCVINVSYDADGATISLDGQEARFDRCGDLARADTVLVPNTIEHFQPTAIAPPAAAEIEAHSWQRFVFTQDAVAQGQSVDVIRDGDIVLHLKFDLSGNALVVNDHVDGAWRTPVRLPAPDLELIAGAELHVLNGEDHVEISLSGAEKIIFSRCGRLLPTDITRFSSQIYLVRDSAIDLGGPADGAAMLDSILAEPAETPAPEQAAEAGDEGRFRRLLGEVAPRLAELAGEIDDARTALRHGITEAGASWDSAELRDLPELGRRLQEMRAWHGTVRQYVADSEARLVGVIRSRSQLLAEFDGAAVEAAREDHAALSARRQRKSARTIALQQARLSAQRRKGLLAGPGPRWALRRGGEAPSGSRVPASAEARTAISPYFDAAHYGAHFLDAPPSDADLLGHYLTIGWRMGLDPHPMFSVLWYQSQYPEATASEPFSDFLLAGEAAGREPHPLFAGKWFAKQLGEAPRAGLFAAFLTGQSGGTAPHPAFDATAYARAAGLADSAPHLALRHYLTEGWRAGLSPSALFDPPFYLAQLDPSGTQGMEPYLHWGVYGAAEDLSPHPLFETRHLRKQVETRGGRMPADPLRHYLDEGEAAGLEPHPLFVPDLYREALPPASAPPVGGALAHYVAQGEKALQTTHWLFDPKFALAQLLPRRLPAGQTPLAFYLQEGQPAFKSPSPFFLVGHYLLALGEALRNEHPLRHFLTSSAGALVSPHPLFDPHHYLQQRQGQARLHDHPLADFMLGVPRHFIASPHPLFDSAYYLAHNPDVARLKMNPLWHYLMFGGKEGRNPSARFQSQFYQQRHNINNTVNPLVHYAIHGQDLGLDTLPEPVTATATVAKPKVSYHTGRKPKLAGGKTILVVAHIAGKFLFGGERSFLDMLAGLATMPVNVIAVLPQNNPIYTKACADLVTEVAICSYVWWRNDNPVSEDHVALFDQIIADRNVDAVHANTIMLREPLIAANRRNIPSVVHVRELIELDEALIKLIGLPPADIIREVRTHASWIIANSRATAHSFGKEGRTFIVPNTMDMDTMDIENPLDGETLRFGLISSNLPKKGVMDLVELARAAETAAPRARFLLIGPDTPLIEELKAGQEKGEVPANLVFPGYAEAPRAAIEQVNVVVNFSHFAESFGRTVLEAMSARRPVIAYEWGALPELVSHEETGFLIPYLKPLEALTSVIAFCRDPDLVRRMGEAARRVAVRDFSTTRYALKMANGYAAILGTPKPAPLSPPLQPHPILAASRATAKPEVVKRARGIPPQGKTSETPRIAYFCWHFPVPSETFVLNELRYLVAQGYDVTVFCRQTPYKDFTPDFPITWERVKSPDDLAEALIRTRRTVAHGHFVYPTVTDFLWPACEKAKIPFTFIAHAQDIFRHDNDTRNRVGEVARAPLCRRVFVLSEFHHNFLVERGVPAEKLVINPNAVDVGYFAQAAIPDRAVRRARAVCAVHRFAPKKGLENLIRAGALLRDEGITIDLYGYGELEDEYRRLIAELNLTNVRIMGRTTNREGLLEVLRNYDLFACPSVRVENGDMDGIPTSVAEAMAAQLPVLTTGISGIPSLVVDGMTGIVVEPTPESIADGIRRFYAMPQPRVASMINAAHHRVQERHDVTRLCRVLLRAWTNQTVDIILVTWKNTVEHREVLRRLYKYTSLPFHVIVCANYDEDPEVVQMLEDYYARYENFTLIYKGYNSFVGPGTNAAIDVGNSDIAIYVCGKEGMVMKQGWELHFIHYFAENPQVGLAGTLCHSPTYMVGADYPKGVREFGNFRNSSFATEHATRPFYHAQGGFFGIRRLMYDEIGGFSEAVPHDYTDVEYSYYTESEGWCLGEVPGLMALFNKSRPPLLTRVDETIAAAHPPALSELEVFDAIASGRRFNCNVCGWNGDAFVVEADEARCPSCHSSRADRSMVRWIAPSLLLHRRLPALSVGLAGGMARLWAEQFQGPRLSWESFVAALKQAGRLPNRPASLHIAALRGLVEDVATLDLAMAEVRRLLVPGGTLVVQASEGDNWLRTAGVPADFAARMETAGFTLEETPLFFSQSVQLDWAPMWVLRKQVETPKLAAE